MAPRYTILYHSRFRLLIFLNSFWKCINASLFRYLFPFCASKNLIQGLQHFIGACCLVFQTFARPLIRATHGKRILHAIQSIFLFIPNLFVMWTVCGRRIRRLMRMDDVAQVFHFSLRHSLFIFFCESNLCREKVKRIAFWEFTFCWLQWCHILLLLHVVMRSLLIRL